MNKNIKNSNETGGLVNVTVMHQTLRKNTLPTEDPWLNPPTPESLILRRKAVDGLNEDILRELINVSQDCIRSKDIEGILGVIGLNLEVRAVEIVNGIKTHAIQNRDQFLVGLFCSLEVGNNENYTMEINSIKLKDQNSALISLTVSNHGNHDFYTLYGQSVDEILEVSLYQGRPVVTRLVVMENA